MKYLYLVSVDVPYLVKDASGEALTRVIGGSVLNAVASGLLPASETGNNLGVHVLYVNTAAGAQQAFVDLAGGVPLAGSDAVPVPITEPTLKRTSWHDIVCIVVLILLFVYEISRVFVK